MTRKIKSLNEFRTHNVSKEEKHPAYIYAKVGDEYVYVGITHASITNGMKNIPLEKNPNPQDSRKAFFRPHSGKDHKSRFGKRKPWKLSNNDKLKVPRK